MKVEKCAPYARWTLSWGTVATGLSIGPIVMLHPWILAVRGIEVLETTRTTAWLVVRAAAHHELVLKLRRCMLVSSRERWRAILLNVTYRRLHLPGIGLVLVRFNPLGDRGRSTGARWR